MPTPDLTEIVAQALTATEDRIAILADAADVALAQANALNKSDLNSAREVGRLFAHKLALVAANLDQFQAVYAAFREHPDIPIEARERLNDLLRQELDFLLYLGKQQRLNIERQLAISNALFPANPIPNQEGGATETVESSPMV